MIPSTPSKLLVAEDWKKIYQSYRNADFQSYDFETLRRVMVSYIQQNYPEDFNDYIDSSEYLALIDLIAYLGQNLSFRIDLNARENFLETASRRDSILQLAQLISYTPTRNLTASGFLKIINVSTTDNVYDSTGVNLANSSITWNDPSNSNWYQQFITVLNSSMPAGYQFGIPIDSGKIDGILTEQYNINSNTPDVPVFSFSKAINGINMDFEIVSSTFSGQNYIYEQAPAPGKAFSYIYQNDNQGSGSANTGFFLQFKQGNIGSTSFVLDNPVPNELIGINVSQINNTDVWLWQLGQSRNFSTLWKQVPSVAGTNVIYNNFTPADRNFYSVTSRDQDQIDLNFSDGTFGNLPKGQFVLLYRKSNSLSYTITPSQMVGVYVRIPYFNALGQSHYLTLTLSLQYTVSNSAPSETNASIQAKAPQSYYLQNRIITGEDYNIAPTALGSDILKSKAVARQTSGLSRYFELSDVSGKYSKTNIFGADGILYKDTYESNFEFTFKNQNDIYVVIKDRLEPIVSSPSLRSFYLEQTHYPRPELASLKVSWTQVKSGSVLNRGYLKNTISGVPVSVGLYASNNLSYLLPGALVKFVPPSGKYFTATGALSTKQSPSTLSYKWVMVSQVIGDGANSGQGTLNDGTGPVILSDVIPTGAIAAEVVPVFVDTYSYSFESSLVSLCLKQKNFGLTIDRITRQWVVISDSDLDLTNPFSLGYQNNTTNAGLDSSWLIVFVWSGYNYRVRYRQTDYIFQSHQETAFYVDPNSVNYDYTTNKLIKDQVNVLSINPSLAPITAANTSTFGSLGVDYRWQIDGNIIEVDGYVDPSRIKVSFYDYNDQGQVTDPDAFIQIAGSDNRVFFEIQSDGQTMALADSMMFNTDYMTQSDALAAIYNMTLSPNDGDLFYFSEPNIINQYVANDNAFEYTMTASNYIAYLGRDSLKFHHIHNSGENRRIDPSKSNLIDLYILTSGYDTEFRNWLISGTGTAPSAPTSQSLDTSYDQILAPLRGISDEVVYQPISYKILFGTKANLALQCKFKAVRNTASTLSDNDIITKILDSINNFFSLQNWDFGQSFYFSELNTYVMNILTPDITNFLIVPTVNNFGSLYEVTCKSNEIFISGATTADIEVLTAVTASALHSTMITTSAG